MMKVKINLPPAATGCALRSMFDPDEIEVAGHLLDLPHLIAQSKPSSSLPFSWGVKRRRSVFYNENSNPSPPPPPPPPPPSSPLQLRIPVLPAIRTAALPDVSSPASPLMVSFSPISECEERVPPNKRRKKKEVKKKEELLQELEERRENIEILKKNIQAVMEYYEKLKAYSFCLKARKEELSSSSSRRIMCTNTSLQSVGMSFSHVTGGSVFVDDQANYRQMPMINSRVHQQPLIMDRTRVVKPEVSSDGFMYPNGHVVCWAAAGPDLGGGGVMNGGSRQLFDDRALSRANAALARHKRRLICKDKYPSSTNKFK